MTAEPHTRQRFGRYETLFRIAGGGMAEVFAARSLGEAGFQKLVALKRMRPELTSDPKFVTMFLDEGRLAANIASPNVVQTLDLGRTDDNSLYLVMELLTGVALQDLLENTIQGGVALPMAMAVDIVTQTANGLHDAHEATSPTGEPLSIVHRDCSPHNILIDVKGQVKVTDFGIAKAMERQTQSHAGEMKGKLCYLSPEQARGQPVDRRTDIFILGIVAWEILAGRLLFDAKNAVEALHMIVAMPIPRLDEINPSVPSAVAEAVHQALSRDPEERYTTAAAFGNALSNALGARPPSRRELGRFVRDHGGDQLSSIESRIRETLVAEREGRLSERPPSMAPTGSGPAWSDTLASLPPPPALPTLMAPVGPLAATMAVPGTRPGNPGVLAELPGEVASPSQPSPARPRAATAPMPLLRGRAKTSILPSDAPPAIPGPAATQPTAAGPNLFALGALLVLLSFTGAAAAAWWWSQTSAADGIDPDPAIAGAPSTPGTEPAGTEPGAQPGPSTTGETVTATAPLPPVIPVPVAGDTSDAPAAPETDTPGSTNDEVNTTDTPSRVGREDGRRGTRSARSQQPTEARPGQRPGTVSGTLTPRGDRAAALHEIPWE